MNMGQRRNKNSSGGLIANNYRQGSRAESLAEYFFSEFCIAERVLKENDFGIDLYCSLMNVQGSMGTTSTLFGVQIKSGVAPFQYRGDSLTQWMKMINIPLIMCRVNRSNLTVEVFSTWALNLLLTGTNNFSEINFIESYSFDSETINLRMPEVIDGKATIWMGPPIIKCSLNDFAQKPDLKKKFEKVLQEWISLDFKNYSKRHVGIPSYFGYTNWQTNESLETSLRSHFSPHVYDYNHSRKAIQLILEASALFALNQGRDHPFVRGMSDLLKVNSLVQISEMDSWHKEQIGLE